MSRDVSPFRFVAGALCLDFVNTVGSHTSFNPGEKLNEFADLVRWAHEAELIDDRETQELLAFAEASSDMKAPEPNPNRTHG